MTVEFKINGNKQVTLIPENSDEKTLLKMCFNEVHHVKIAPGPDPDCIVLQPVKTAEAGA